MISKSGLDEIGCEKEGDGIKADIDKRPGKVISSPVKGTTKALLYTYVSNHKILVPNVNILTISCCVMCI